MVDPSIPSRRPHSEARLAAIIERLKVGPCPVERLAEELGVSKQTLSKCMTALRERGHDVRTIRGPEGWTYSYEPDVPSDDPAASK